MYIKMVFQTTGIYSIKHPGATSGTEATKVRYFFQESKTILTFYNGPEDV